MKRVALTAVLLIFILQSVWTIGAQTTLSTVRAFREAREVEIISELVDFLAIPNVAADTPNIRRNAERLLAMMRKRGIESRLLEGNGPPSVFGELKAPGATQTICIYAHYDGQPVDASKWANDPFKPTLRDKPLDQGGQVIAFPKSGEKFNPEWRLYARSASDDKAPIIAVLAALDALQAMNKKPTVNLKFFFEGEEEAGSANLEDMVKRHAALLKADVWICADGPVHQTRKQQIVFGARGVTALTITLYGPERGLHSGHYGNWAPNPAMRLAKLLASMKDDKGRVLVEGFYKDVEPLGDAERRAIKEMPEIDEALKRELGIGQTEGGGRALGDLINEPSLNIDGIRSEYVGAEARNIIPAEAIATIDLRLVKGIDPRRQVERVIAHIKKQGYFVTPDEPTREVRLAHPMVARVTSASGYPAVRTSMTLPVAQKIIGAVEQAVGYKPILTPTLGGSVPLYIFETALQSPQIILPIVNHDNNQHAANENLRIKNLWDGIEIFAALMTMN
jgi:acetylornithine deacetylase/succinyl-diaminopimelate desuccinylase-like protein